MYAFKLAALKTLSTLTGELVARLVSLIIQFRSELYGSASRYCKSALPAQTTSRVWQYFQLIKTLSRFGCVLF
jgi:hypothetical protein